MEHLDRIEELIKELKQEMKIPDQELYVRREYVRRGVVELVGFMARGMKIEAIKQYRQLTGHGLKESKDAIEGAYNGVREHWR